MKLASVLDEYIFDCEIRNFTKKTLKYYRNNCEYLFAFIKKEFDIDSIEDVNTSHIKRFLMWQTQKGCKGSYINGLIKAYRAFFKYAYNEDYIKDNPLLKIKWSKEDLPVIKTFTDDEVKRMINAYSGNDYMSIRNRAILYFLFDTGIRNNELCVLPLNAIKNNNSILIYGKGHKERNVGMSPFLSKMLIKFLRCRESYFDCKNLMYNNLFLSRTGKPLTPEAVERIVKVAGELSGIRKEVRCSPHTCRHYFAQSQVKNGIDVYSLSRIMGHNNISITQRYLNSMRDGDIVEKSIKSSPLMNLM